jgi:hypothetical protein
MVSWSLGWFARNHDLTYPAQDASPLAVVASDRC